MSTQIYGIRSKGLNEFISFGSKCAWLKPGYAKNAFNLHAWDFKRSGIKFDEQDDYEIVELTNYVFMYEGLCK